MKINNIILSSIFILVSYNCMAVKMPDRKHNKSGYWINTVYGTIEYPNGVVDTTWIRRYIVDKPRTLKEV